MPIRDAGGAVSVTTGGPSIANFAIIPPIVITSRRRITGMTNRNVTFFFPFFSMYSTCLTAININMLYVFPLSTNYRQGLRLIISVAASPVVYAYAVDHSSYQEALLAGKCGARLQALPLASHTPELHFLYVNNLAGPA